MRSKIHQPVPELPVRDVEKAQEFYRNVLGFSIAWLFSDKSIGAVNLEEAVIFLSRQEFVVPQTLWFFVDDVDAIYNELSEASAPISEAIETKPWNIRQFVMNDLDGNRLIFHHDVR